MKSVTLLGAGSHARAVISLLNESGYDIDYIVDINSHEMTDERINNIPVVHKDFNLNGNQIVLSLGDNMLRKAYFLNQENILQSNIVACSAYFDITQKIGDSNQVFANVFISKDVRIGNNNIINTGATIEHGSIIGSHNHISIGAVIAGKVNIGNQCFIGANSTVIDKVNICDNVIIGAGGVVIDNISQPGTYVGNPVRKIK